MRRALIGVLAIIAAWATPAVAAAATPAAATPAAATPAAPPFASADGLHVLTVKALDQRLLALTVMTPALPATMNMRILLPKGYAAHPNRRYPVLYLFHGTSGTASDWTVKGNAEQATAGKPLIVVMPDIAINDGGGGWCTNWPSGTQNWETFEISEVVPFVDHNLRTLATRDERAIAGLSQGGFCSMSLAAQFPSRFGVALAYSGAPDIAYDPTARAGALAIINATEVGLDHVPPDSMFGDPITNYLNYADHDPATLANNLRWTKLYMYFGNGMAGPYDTNPPNPAAASIESLVYTDNIDFHSRLVALGIKPAVYDYYGNGTHSWPYWDRDLTWSIGKVMADFAHPAPAPKSFSYVTGSTDYSLYGWQIKMHRRVDEFSTLTTNRTGGFTLAGSGSATVVTPHVYRPGATYAVTVKSQSATKTEHVRASRAGNLSLTVTLAPSDTVQEYWNGGPPASSPGTTVYTTSVTIAQGAKS